MWFAHIRPLWTLEEKKNLFWAGEGVKQQLSDVAWVYMLVKALSGGVIAYHFWLFSFPTVSHRSPLFFAVYSSSCDKRRNNPVDKTNHKKPYCNFTPPRNYVLWTTELKKSWTDLDKICRICCWLAGCYVHLHRLCWPLERVVPVDPQQVQLIS